MLSLEELEAVEDEAVPASVVVAPESLPPPAVPEGDSHPVDDVSPDKVVELEKGLEVELTVELANVVEAKVDEKEGDRTDCEGVKLAESVLEMEEELVEAVIVDSSDGREDDELINEEVSDAELKSAQHIQHLGGA